MPVLMGLAALIGMTPVMLFFGSGASQFGARHFVQIYPFLLVLLAMVSCDGSINSRGY